MPRNIHSRFSKNNLLLSLKLVFLRKLHLPSKLASRPTRKSKALQNAPFIFSRDKHFSHCIHFDEHLSRCVCFSFVGFLPFVFLLMVYSPAVSVFEVLFPNKRPPMLRDGVCQWRRGTCVSALVCLYVCLIVCVGRQSISVVMLSLIFAYLCGCGELKMLLVVREKLERSASSYLVMLPRFEETSFGKIVTNIKLSTKIINNR